MSHPFYNIPKIHLSHSSMQTFDSSCKRRWEFSKLYRKRKRDRSIAGDVGNAMHSAYQTFLLHGRKVDPGILALMLNYPIDINRNVEDLRSLEACYATYMAMTNSYAMLEYEIVTIECLDGVKRPAIEVPFEIKLNGLELIPGVPLVYIGFIDAILYNTLRDSYEVVDIKTHRDNKDDLTAKYRFDEQCIPYAMVIESNLGLPVDTLKTNYLSAYIDVTNPKVGLYPQYRTTQDVEDWARGLLVSVKEMQTFFDMGWFPRNANGCYNYNRKCGFFDICHSRDHAEVEQWFTQGVKIEDEIDDFTPWLSMELDLVSS